MSHTRYIILLGEPVVIYFPEKRTYVDTEYCWIVHVKNVVQPQNLQAICSSLVQGLNVFGGARSFQLLSDRVSFILSLIYFGFC